MTMHADVATRTAAKVLVDQLHIQGITHVFCVPGESYLPVLDALLGSGIKPRLFNSALKVSGPSSSN